MVEFRLNIIFKLFNILQLILILTNMMICSLYLFTLIFDCFIKHWLIIWNFFLTIYNSNRLTKVLFISFVTEWFTFMLILPIWLVSIMFSDLRSLIFMIINRFNLDLNVIFYSLILKVKIFSFLIIILRFIFFTSKNLIYPNIWVCWGWQNFLTLSKSIISWEFVSIIKFFMPWAWLCFNRNTTAVFFGF